MIKSVFTSASHLLPNVPFLIIKIHLSSYCSDSWCLCCCCCVNVATTFHSLLATIFLLLATTYWHWHWDKQASFVTARLLDPICMKVVVVSNVAMAVCLTLPSSARRELPMSLVPHKNYVFFIQIQFENHDLIKIILFCVICWSIAAHCCVGLRGVLWFLLQEVDFLREKVVKIFI